MPQYDSRNFPLQKKPEPEGLWKKFWQSTAICLPHSVPNDHRPAAMLRFVSLKDYLEAKEQPDFGEDFNHKHILVEGFSSWVLAYINFCAMAKMVALVIAPLFLIYLTIVDFFVPPEPDDYNLYFLAIKIALIAAFFWLQLELLTRYKVQLPWMKLTKQFKISRETGLVTLYGKHNKVVFEHPFIEFDYFLTTRPTPQGFILYEPLLVHRYGGYSRGVSFAMFMTESEEINEYGRLWNTIQAYMDVSQPLPDIIQLEPFRALDPTTAAYDIEHKRKPDFWGSMTEEQYEKTINKIIKKQRNQPYTGETLNIYAPEEQVGSEPKSLDGTDATNKDPSSS